MLFILVSLLFAMIHNAKACLCFTHSNNVTENLERYAVVGKFWIGNEISTTATPCAAGTYCLGQFRDRFFEAYVDIVFKGGNTNGQGKLVVRSPGFCGRTTATTLQTDILLYGNIQQQEVDGYYGTVAVFTPAFCAAHSPWAELSADDQNALFEYAHGGP